MILPNSTRLVVFRFLCVIVGTLPVVRGDEPIGFNEHIRPILASHCLECHGPDANNREADLRLDLEKEAKQQAITPRKPQESELYRRITANDPDLVMPPAETGKRLTAKEIATLKQWIVEGAIYEGHWAFQPIRTATPPQTGETRMTEIDRFLVAALNEKNLSYSKPVNRRQWIRRATFDLIGLPPSWAEVQAFVSDTSSAAYEKVIDRLLASPRYGERWGRHWLDIARYADTHGGSAIGFTRFPFSYTYRDYVIDAFNRDLPYDQFVTQQLAADQLGLPRDDPALAGLGFLTVGMQYRNPHDTIDDQIDVVTRGFLGLTVACARCHDHKYDAIPTEDYYSLYATFASSENPELLPLIGKPPKSEDYRKYNHELKHKQAQHDEMTQEQTAIMRGRLRMQVGLYLKELAKGTPEQDLSAAFLSYRTDDVRPLVLNRWRDYLKELPKDDPVFGPWFRLVELEPKNFAAESLQTIQTLTKENGDLSNLPPMEKLNAKSPRWNPRVLETLGKKKPKSLLEVAEAYGTLFGEVHQEWLKGLLASSLEAQPGNKVVPDEDVRHRDINSAINRQLRRHLYAPGSPTAMKEQIAGTLLNRPIRDNIRGRKNAIHNLHLKSPGSPPRAMALQEDKQAGPFTVFRRGNPIDRGKPVEGRFLTALSPANPKPFPKGKRRLGLAEAIVDPANPLTRRVIVNWVWRHHFGRGLVRTPDDFGTRGQPPTHPELLDYLASTFQEDGWSLKKLHRRIMLSVAYRQGAMEQAESRVKDPENLLLWRMPRRRLDLEAMRDAMLAVSGELSLKKGGRPFELLSKPVVPRRSVYAFVNRDIITPLASTFDAANPNACTAKRPETQVPQQTLFALNSRFIQDRARAFTARKEFQQAKTSEERVRVLYRTALSREPEPEETLVAIRYITSQKKPSQTTPWQRLAHVLLASNEFVFVD